MRIKILIIEFLIFCSIALLLNFGFVELNFARYNYTYVKSTLMVKDWLGSPYIIKELNSQNRCFEKGSLMLKGYKWNIEDKILSNYPFFFTLLNVGEKTYQFPGDSVEICIDLIQEKITPTSEELFEKEYNINFTMDVQIVNLVTNDIIANDYYIEFSSKLNMLGLTTEKYNALKIREFALFRTLDLLKEYSILQNLIASEEAD